MTIREWHIPKRVNQPDVTIKPIGIILHYIGNPGTTAQQNANYFHNVDELISVHYIVDDNEIVEIIPPTKKSYGTSSKAHNEAYVQIEMCHPDASGEISEATLEKTVWLCRKLMADHGITEIIRHYDVTGKHCPLWYVDAVRWAELKARILSGVEGGEEMTEQDVIRIVEGVLEAYGLIVPAPEPEPKSEYRAQDGLHIVDIPAGEFRIAMWDSAKKTIAIKNYFNAGFFGNYQEQGVNFTLPDAPLVADIIQEAPLNSLTSHYLHEWGSIEGSKVRINSRNGNKRSTLLVQDGRARIAQVDVLPEGVDYAVCGIPAIIGGEDVSWADYAQPEGWDSSPLYATWHSLLAANDDGSVTYIGMKTQTSNCMTSSEIYNKLRPLGYKNVLILDGGGSYILDVGGSNKEATNENRRINTVGLF